MEFSMRAMGPGELKEIYRSIKKDFAFGEFAPYHVLKKQLQTGTQKGYLFFADGRAAAYCICAQERPSGFVLMSYFAVFADCRGRGVGTAFLKKLQKTYSDAKGMVAEVEKPEDAKTDALRKLRERRIVFYRRAGFEIVPGMDYSIWNVPMYLMVFPPDGINLREAGGAVRDIYLSLMGRRFIHMLKVRYR